jgi:ketosteroid isomerase-like protein
MSQENVERAREFFEAWSRNDAKAVERLLRDFVTPDVEIDPLYLDQVYTGIEGFLEMRADLVETWEDYRLEVEEIIDLDQRLLVIGRILGRGAGSGVPIKQRLAMLITMDGDEVTRMKSFASKHEALEAAGLSE